MKRKGSPITADFKNNKKPFQSTKSLIRSKSLPKESTKSIFHDTDSKIKETEKQWLKARKQGEKQLERIDRRRREIYAPYDALNWFDLKKNFENSEDYKEVAETYKTAAQTMLYKSKQFEKLNKDRIKSGQESIKTIPKKVSNLEKVGGILMEYSHKNKNISDEFKEKHENGKLRNLDLQNKNFFHFKRIERADRHIADERKNEDLIRTSIELASKKKEDFLKQNEKYIKLTQQPVKKRPKSVG